MAQILQNRDEKELKEILEKFLLALKFQHEIDLSLNGLLTIAAQTMEYKLNELIANKMSDFSIPELKKIMKIADDDRSETSAEKFINSKKKITKSKLQ